VIDDDPKARRDLNRMGIVVATLLTVALLFIVVALVYMEIPVANQQALMIVIGLIGGLVGTVVNWLFGTSAAKKSSDKAEPASDITTTAPAGATVTTQVKP